MSFILKRTWLSAIAFIAIISALVVFDFSQSQVNAQVPMQQFMCIQRACEVIFPGGQRRIWTPQGYRMQVVGPTRVTCPNMGLPPGAACSCPYNMTVHPGRVIEWNRCTQIR